MQAIGEGQSVDAYRAKENLAALLLKQGKEEEVEELYWDICKSCTLRYIYHHYLYIRLGFGAKLMLILHTKEWGQTSLLICENLR